MEGYRHILAAVEAREDDGPRVLHHAWGLAHRFEARLSLVHVVEYLPVDPAGDRDAGVGTPAIERPLRLFAALVGEVERCGEQRVADTWVTVGSITQEILRARGESGADLIVIGHRSRRGLAALFSSTDDGVLHHACCDVLAMHLD